MAKKCYIGDYSEDEKALVLKDETELPIPERTADIYEEIVAIEKRRATMTEYDFYKAMLERLFGKDGFKKIAPDGKKTNLNYIARVYSASIDLFTQEKSELEAEEIAKKSEPLNPIMNDLKVVNSVADKIK